jgi:hypothetical protein
MILLLRGSGRAISANPIPRRALQHFRHSYYVVFIRRDVTFELAVISVVIS